jgi:hypothetical protein
MENGTQESGSATPRRSRSYTADELSDAISAVQSEVDDGAFSFNGLFGDDEEAVVAWITRNIVLRGVDPGHFLTHLALGIRMAEARRD